MDDLNNGSVESDPAADFLAREQSAFASIESENDFVRINSDNIVPAMGEFDQNGGFDMMNSQPENPVSMQDEPEKIKMWREEQKLILEKKKMKKKQEKKKNYVNKRNKNLKIGIDNMRKQFQKPKHQIGNQLKMLKNNVFNLKMKILNPALNGRELPSYVILIQKLVNQAKIYHACDQSYCN